MVHDLLDKAEDASPRCVPEIRKSAAATDAFRNDEESLWDTAVDAWGPKSEGNNSNGSSLCCCFGPPLHPMPSDGLQRCTHLQCEPKYLRRLAQSQLHLQRSSPNACHCWGPKCRDPQLLLCTCLRMEAFMTESLVKYLWSVSAVHRLCLFASTLLYLAGRCCTA